MCELDDDAELELDETALMIAFCAFGLILADLIAHPEGMRKLLEIQHG